MNLIPSRHTLPLVQHNTTKNANLDPLKNTQHFSAIHTEFLSKYNGLHLLQKRSEIKQDENPISQSLINAISKQFSTFLLRKNSVKNSNMFFYIKTKLFVA